MTLSRVALFLALSSAAFCPHSAAQAEGKADLSYSGTVINSATGEPIRRAFVELLHFGHRDVAPPADASSPGVPAAPASKSAFTDAGGAFRFEGLGRGTYRVAANKPGFAPGPATEGGEPRQFDLENSREGVRLQLAPLGVISGRVTGSDGQPLRFITISLLTRTVTEGLRRAAPARTVATDDRGQYRLWNLAPGKYFLRAGGRAAVTLSYPGDQAPVFAEYESSVPAYFPGAPDLESASAIEIKPGSTLQADLTLRLEPARKVRGRLRDVAPDEPVTFELLQQGENVRAGLASVNAYTGAFQLHDVAPGTYTLRATQGRRARGETPLTVGEKDVDGVVVTLSPAVDLKFVMRTANAPPVADQRVRADDSDSGPAPGDGVVPGAVGRAGPQYACLPQVKPERGNPQAPEPEDNESAPGQPGELTVRNLLPGSYRLQWTCFNGYATAVRMGEADLLANPLFTLAPGAAPPPVEADLRIGGGTLQGEIAATAQGHQPGVLLVPTDPGRAGQMTMAAAFLNAADGPSRLSFAQGSLAPGSYVAYAFEDQDEVEFRRPGFTAALSGGTAVQIEDGKTAQIRIEGFNR